MELPGAIRPDGAVHDAVVGQAEGGLIELRRPRRHRVDLAGAVKQRVLAVGMEVYGRGGAHASPMMPIAPDGAGTISQAFALVTG